MLRKSGKYPQNPNKNRELTKNVFFLQLIIVTSWHNQSSSSEQADEKIIQLENKKVLHTPHSNNHASTGMRVQRACLEVPYASPFFNYLI